MAIDKLHGKRINTVRKKRTKKRLSSRYRTGLFSQLKQIAADQNTPKATPTGPFKGIVIRVEHECPGGGLGIFGGLSWLSYWYSTIMGQQQPPEMVKCKVRIPGIHSYLPDPEKYGCDPGPWQKVIDLHPTFTASSQNVEPPAVGDMVIVDFSDAETESDPIIISTVVVRESDGGMNKGGSCPVEDIFNSAEESAPLAATSEEGDAQGGTETEALSPASIPGSDGFMGSDSSPVAGQKASGRAGSSPTSPLDAVKNATSEVSTSLPPVAGRSEDGTANPVAMPLKRKGIFISESSLGSTDGLESPMAAVKRAKWAGIGFVAIQACHQGPPYGTSSSPMMHRGDLNKIRSYVEAFRTVGINVYLWGTPWPGLAREYSDFMTTACVDMGAHGIIMSPSWGYFSENNSAKYSKQANFLTTTLMAQAKDKNIVVGFTNEWNPASAYRVNGSSSTISRYRDSFPYACFSGVDFAVAQLLSTDGNSARYTNTDGSVEILSEEGQYARETTATFSQGIQDYINYGFSNIIPALGAIGEKYHDYGYDSRKPPERIKEEIGFLVSGSTEGFGAQAPDKSNDYGLFELASVEESVMWWDWASANDTSPCWDSDRWTTIKEFNSFGLASDLAAAEGGAGTNTRTSAASTAEYSSAMKGIDMFKRLAVRNEWLTESQAASISPQILRAPALSILGVSSVSELSALAQSAAATLKSSATELGIDHGDFTTDVLAPTDTGLPSWMSDPPDLGVVTGSPSREEIEEWDLGPMSPDGTYAMLALPDYINYDSPADPWQYKGGWCPVHGYVTGTGMTAASRTPDDIFYIMLHTTAGSGQSAGFGWFQDPTCGASTHYGVNTGGYVYQGVREKDIAWHAGEKSSSRPGSPGEDKYSGRNNSNGIGIEIAGIIPDEKAQPGRFYSEEMYEGLAYLCASIASRNGISIDREHIIGHDEVRKDKIDPGSDLDDQERSYDLRSDHGHYEYESVFDYRKLFTMINEYLAGAGVPIPLSTGFPSGAPPSAAAAGQGGVDAGGCEAASAAGASVVGGVNPTTIMPLSEVPDNTPAASASSGAFLESSTAPPGVITLFGVSARSLVAADLSSLPDGPNLTFDYTPDPTNFGKESPTKIIDQLPIATDLAHYLYAMIKAAEGDGIPLSLNSVWRNNPDIAAGGSGSGTWKSSKGQQTLYDANCSSGTCSPSTARPGTSRHQLGVAVDIAGTTPVGSAIFEWLSKNAEAFGFYRSVSSERWHWVLDPAKNKYARVASDHASWTN